MKNFVAALAMVGIMAMPAFARPSKTVAPDVPLDVIVQHQFTASSGFTIIWGDFVTTTTLPQSSPSTIRHPEDGAENLSGLNRSLWSRLRMSL